MNDIGTSKNENKSKNVNDYFRNEKENGKTVFYCMVERKGKICNARRVDQRARIEEHVKECLNMKHSEEYMKHSEEYMEIGGSYVCRYNGCIAKQFIYKSEKKILEHVEKCKNKLNGLRSKEETTAIMSHKITDNPRKNESMKETKNVSEEIKNASEETKNTSSEETKDVLGSVLENVLEETKNVSSEEKQKMIELILKHEKNKFVVGEKNDNMKNKNKSQRIGSKNAKMTTLIENEMIRYLYHISDIHIRLYSKHKEYREVFETLYEMLNKEPKGLIVITGDILHNKNELTPQCIDMMNEMLINLSNIMPIIMIGGNHDMLVNSRGCLDSLESILRNTTIKNLYYQNKTGLYKYGNVMFVINSLADNQYILIDEEDERFENHVKVGLYHGPVGNINSNDLYNYTGDILLKEVNGYDIMCLGDFHNHVYLNENKTIAYASSLISQNYEEISDDHGYIKWDILEKSGEYKRVKNNYQYRVYYVIEGKIYIDNIGYDLNGEEEIKAYIPTYAKIKLKPYNTSTEQLYAIMDKLKQKYPNVEITKDMKNCKKELNKTISEWLNKSSNGRRNINVDEMLKEGIKAYVKKADTYLSEQILSVIKENMELSELINEKRGDWEINNLEFDNMYGYGENNKLDFMQYDNGIIIGLFSQNSFGKSTLINIVTYALFEKTNSSKNEIPDDIINVDKNSFRVTLEFKIGNEIYTITRSGNRLKNGTIQLNHPELIKKDDNQNILELCKDKYEINKKIVEMIGNYEDYCLTNIFLQLNEDSFKNMTSSKQLETLYRIMKLDTYKKTNEKIDVKLKTLNTEKKVLMGIQKSINIEEVKKNISENTEKIELINTELNYINDQIFCCENKRIDLENQLKDIETIDINDIENKILNNNKKIDTYNKELQDYKDLHTKLINEKNAIIIESEYEILKNHEFYLNDKNNKTKKYVEEIAILKSKIKKVNNVVTLDKFNSLSNENFEIEKDIHDKASKLIDLNNLLSETYQNKIDKNLYDINVNNKNKKDKINNEIEFYKKSNKAFSDIFYDNKCQSCIKNKKIIDEISNVTKINSLLQEIDALIVNEEIIMKYEKQCGLINDLNIEISKLNKYVSDKKITLENNEYNIDLYEVNNNNILFNNQIEEIEKLKNISDKCQDTQYDEYIVNKNNFNNYEIKISQLNNNISHKNELIDLAKNELTRLNNLKNKHNECVLIIEHNNLLKSQINDCDKKCNAFRSEQLEKSKLLSRLTTELNLNSKSFDNYSLNIKQINDFDEKIKLYNYAEKITGEKGIQLSQLKLGISYINEYIDDFVFNFTNIRVKLDLIGTCLKINGYKNDKKMSTFGGMQTFIINLAIKIALSNISELNRCNLLFLDEGISAIDPLHIEIFDSVSDFLRDNYDKVILISHIQTIKGCVDTELHINKINNFSHIDNTIH